MLLYDWSKIFEESQGSTVAIYLIFKMLTTSQIPTNKYDKIYKYFEKDFKGEGFLAHPDVLLFHSYKHSHREIAQYLALAAARPLSDYLATGKTSLEYVKVDFISRDTIEDNSLLHIDENDVIHFLYEEVNKEKLH